MCSRFHKKAEAPLEKVKKYRSDIWYILHSLIKLKYLISQQVQLNIYLLRRDEDRQQPRPPGLQTLVSEPALSSHVNSVPQPHSSWVDTNTKPFQQFLQTLTLLGEAVVHPEHGAVPHGAADQLVAPKQHIY